MRLFLIVCLAGAGCHASAHEQPATTTSSGTGGAGGAGGVGGAAPHQHIATLAAPSGFVAQPDGSYRLEDSFAVFDATRAFYESYGDDYDFVVLWTDFLVQEIWQFSLATRVDIQGIGQDAIYDAWNWPHDWYVEAGSQGRLQAVIFMNHRSLWDQSGFTAQDILVHETGHRWAAYVHFPSQADPFALLDDNLAHWTVTAGIGASALGYAETIDNGDGTFVSTAKKPLAYAPLELYTMGLLGADAAELQGMFYVDAPFDFSPPRANADSVNGNGVVTFRGERVELPMSTIVAELGPRAPDHRAAQRDFRFAFVLLCATAESCSAASLAWLEGERQSWPGSFDAATGSRARATTEL